MKLDPLSVGKFTVSAIVGIGTGKIVGAIIKNNVKPETVFAKVVVVAATWTIGAIVTEATKKYTDDMIDDLVETATELVRSHKRNEKVNRINKGLSTFEKEGLDQARFRRNESGHWVPISQEEYEDIWGKSLDANDVLDILKSGEWKYSITDNSWASKDKRGKTLSTIKQTRQDNGTIKWVMVDGV